MDQIHDMIENETLMSVLLVGMFFLSGINKVANFQNVVESFYKKTNIDTKYAELAIYAVVILEILAPLCIVYYFVTRNKEYQTYAYYSTLSLIAFTILATVVYHPPDFSNYYKSVPFWANVSLVGGLMLLAKLVKM